ncbi:MAG: hypothetical protein UY98_C0041G0004 [Candidatus Kaiserbacteria bacterium GW2011_GWA2_58_9]|uniref:Uncharacterized protein n=1 Tax=Candidatus Kaiserbacteria bacterium GW2011_GWA2_58_9 TaxID=1618672 RepID=A0A0G2AVU2_9BACT|nr:MAG: hypothetical protein UY98_C0041G0004 [Candidatus Kaiserbacteria bacterium GW2011_GWA2_58_9]
MAEGAPPNLGSRANAGADARSCFNLDSCCEYGGRGYIERFCRCERVNDLGGLDNDSVTHYQIRAAARQAPRFVFGLK